MKIFSLTFLIIIFIISCYIPSALAQRVQDEIIIEMTGAPAPATPTLWDYNARQITRQLKNKTREEVLIAMPMVSNKDRTIKGKHRQYALVEYTDGNNFRKLLFKSEEPQTFITAAATPADVLSINKKYGINIGLTRRAFENFYQAKAAQETCPYLPDGHTLYKLSYKDINTPKAQDCWFLFEKDQLTLTFETLADKDAHLSALQKKAEEKQKAEEAQKARAAQQTQQQAQNNRIVTGLISGGTEWDRAYMPRVVNPKLLPTPTLTPPSNQKKK